MLHHIEPADLPRALAHLMARDNTDAPNDTPTALPRRSFLKLAGASGLALGLYPALGQAQEKSPEGLKPSQQPAAFVRIAPNGEVTVTVNRLEFGQGVMTGLAMVLAEELDADWRQVRAQHGTGDAAYADPQFGIHLTGGSNSIKNSYTQYRELGAPAPCC